MMDRSADGLPNQKEPKETFICERIKPVEGTYDASAMSIGEPGFPGQFVWRKKEYFLAEILEKGSTQDGRIAMHFEEHPAEFAREPLEKALKRAEPGSSGERWIRNALKAQK